MEIYIRFKTFQPFIKQFSIKNKPLCEEKDF